MTTNYREPVSGSAVDHRIFAITIGVVSPRHCGDFGTRLESGWAIDIKSGSAYDLLEYRLKVNDLIVLEEEVPERRLIKLQAK